MACCFSFHRALILVLVLLPAIALALDFSLDSLALKIESFFDCLATPWRKVMEVVHPPVTSTTLSSTTSTSLPPKVTDTFLLMEARRLNDSGFCVEITNTRLRDVCFETLAFKLGNTHYCTRVSSVEGRDDCLLSVAVALDNQVLCTLINDSLAAAQCKKQTSFT